MPEYVLHRDPASSHQQIAAMVRVMKHGPVLDVGAGPGFLGQLTAGDGLDIDAVEPNPDWAEQARPFYRRVYPAPVEAAELPAAAYRVVVCADVLEHTVEPVAVLETLAGASTADARFIVSLPNVAHLAVRVLLLFGRFPRMERGILDRTHLHFFTRDTAADLLRDAGLVVLAVRPTGVPLDEVWPWGDGPVLTWLQRLQHVALRMAPRLFAFQWIFVARKR